MGAVEAVPDVMAGAIANSSHNKYEKYLYKSKNSEQNRILTFLLRQDFPENAEKRN